MLLELDQLIAHFNYCKNVIQSLIKSSKGTAELVSKGKLRRHLFQAAENEFWFQLNQIREFHLADEIGRSSKALEASMIALKNISTERILKMLIWYDWQGIIVRTQ